MASDCHRASASAFVGNRQPVWPLMVPAQKEVPVVKVNVVALANSEEG